MCMREEATLVNTYPYLLTIPVDDTDFHLQVLWRRLASPLKLRTDQRDVKVIAHFACEDTKQ